MADITVNCSDTHATDMFAQFPKCKDKVQCDFAVRSEDGHVIPCHKFPLIACVPKVQQTVARETSKLDFTFPFVVINALINFIYTGTLTVSEEHIIPAIRMLHELELCELLNGFISKVRLNDSNVIQIWRVSQELDLADLQQMCLNFLVECPDISSIDRFTDLTINEMQSYLNSVQSKSGTPDSLLLAITHWVEKAVHGHCRYLYALVSSMRLSHCSTQLVDDFMSKYHHVCDMELMDWMMTRRSSRDSQHSSDALIVAGGASTSGGTNQQMLMLSHGQIQHYSDLPDNVPEEHSICSTPDGLILICSDRTCWSFQHVDKSWHPLADFPSTRQWLACVWLNGDVWVFGGSGTSSVYRLRQGQWQSQASAPVHLHWPRAVIACQHIYVIAEVTDDLVNVMLWCVDESTMEWSVLAPPPVRSSKGLSHCQWQNEIYTAGGEGNVRQLSCYTPCTNTWTRYELPVRHRWGALAVKDNTIYLVGGVYSQEITECQLGSDDTITRITSYPLKDRILDIFAFLF